MDKLHKIAQALNMSAELAQIEEECVIKNVAFHLLSLWNQKADTREKLAEVLADVGLEEVSRKYMQSVVYKKAYTESFRWKLPDDATSALPKIPETSLIPVGIEINK